MNKEDILSLAKEVCFIERESVEQLCNKIDKPFLDAIDLILGCEGRVIITGMGKSGLIGRKIAATLSSTGTPSLFLHPAEGIHGDLGMVTGKDLVIAISYSGENTELITILPVLKRIGVKVIAMTGNLSSTLSTFADIVLDIGVKKEACPYNIVPTSSTTVTLVLGDAIAICLLKLRNFRPQDFALFHPGGALGRSLITRVCDLMHKGEENPVVSLETIVREALFEISKKGLGAVSVVDKNGILKGIITDGDIRRKIEIDDMFLKRRAEEVMTKNPIYIYENRLATEALKILQDRKINLLPVVDEKLKVVGMIHLHDILKAGIV
ncbi:KpsF/GutQ family protein [Thermodesulfobium narugense DSM 14796]|uniref:KpsF/GutQ family protein n=1 Tax=Thermodesulfobium narugense DSM 14796 TaxID=747365 RepID=M1E5Q9_9BACT|nr:KpsF/GutQ family sugar-phosphate isomerase [Thermodesulfobium narugense]AEE13715.1 KpsF/GutQ family protein [Thermodesulfobium narugense DSM 14796]